MAPRSLDFDALARDFLRAIRGRRSQRAFSRRLGKRSNVAYAWEAGLRAPTAAEALRGAARAGIDVEGALAVFTGGAAALAAHPPGSSAGVAALLRHLAGETPTVALARTAERSRFAIARWLSGTAQPRLPDFFRVVQAASLRVLDLVACFVDPSTLPSARAAWHRLDALRSLAYRHPQSEAVLAVLELESYRALSRHDDGWIARRIGWPKRAVAECVQALHDAGVVARRRGLLWTDPRRAVDTRADPEAVLGLKRFWAQVGLERLGSTPDGLFSYNVFTVSEATLAELRTLHLAHYERMRALIASSQPSERVVVANLQLVPLSISAVPPSSTRPRAKTRSSRPRRVG
jgi:hypothetical protein